MELVRVHSSRMEALRMVIFWHLFYLTNPLSFLCRWGAFYPSSAGACPSLLNIIILYKLSQAFYIKELLRAISFEKKPEQFIIAVGLRLVGCPYSQINIFYNSLAECLSVYFSPTRSRSYSRLLKLIAAIILYLFLHLSTLPAVILQLQIQPPKGKLAIKAVLTADKINRPMSAAAKLNKITRRRLQKTKKRKNW